jgi:hypothetical protein
MVNPVRKGKTLNHALRKAIAFFFLFPSRMRGFLSGEINPTFYHADNDKLSKKEKADHSH